jgi:hypothetical protein
VGSRESLIVNREEQLGKALAISYWLKALSGNGQ